MNEPSHCRARSSMPGAGVGAGNGSNAAVVVTPIYWGSFAALPFRFLTNSS